MGEIFRPIVEQIAYFSLSAVRRDKRKDRKGAASANLGRATIDRVPVKECSKVVANLFDREFFCSLECYHHLNDLFPPDF